MIPPSTEPPPRLQLPPHGVPRHGSISPLLIRSTNGLQDEDTPKWAQHPRHRLGVACLALDTSTQLVGRSSPEGILYSGARDGLVCSWDLGITMKQREHRYGAPARSMRTGAGRWEIMTGWTDDIIEEDPEEAEEYRSTGDILGEVRGSGARERWRRNSVREQPVPYEQQWETDMEMYQEGKISQFRQCAQIHSDWINDVLLCNLNQTVVTASSDGTVKAWSPHSFSEPSVIGTHADYVRCLASSREQNWVASGSFDRTIKLWDLAGSPTTKDPLITLQPPETSGPKGSIYALATDSHGSVIVAGSPERVVRMWDPRSGKRIGKLVGHTDNIRAILISDDSRYLLTGSADASIKLWSLSSQRCLHTFTHHTESVWSLFSSHPSLEAFYSGDRSGLVCKVDLEGCSDISEGECIVLCQDNGDSSLSSPEGVNKIVVMDDNLLWTASANSSIKRWKVPCRRAVRSGCKEVDSPTTSEFASDYIPLNRSPQRGSNEVARSRSPPRSPSSPSSFLKKSHRVSITPSLSGSVLSENSAYNQDKEGEETWYGLPFESLVKLTSPNETFTTLGMSRGRDPEIATLYSAASVMSVPRINRPPLQPTFLNTGRSVSPAPGDTLLSRPVEETLHPMRTARMEYEEREVAADAVPLYSTPDYIIHGDHGLVRSVILNDRIHALTVDTAGEVAVWNIVRGTCLGKFSSEDVAAASFCGSTSGRSGTGEKEYSPREALEAVKERIEGEAVVLPWATVDTKTGVLSVHLNGKCFEAEIYADEAGYGPERQFADDMRLNVGKWVLKNLFSSFIKEQQRAISRRNRDIAAQEAGHRLQRGGAPTHIDLDPHTSSNRGRSSSDASRTSPSNTHSSPSSSASRSPVVVISPTLIPAASPVTVPASRYPPLRTPPSIVTGGGYKRESFILSPIPQSPSTINDATPMPRPVRRSSTTDGNNLHSAKDAATTNDYFSLRGQRPSSGGDAGAGTVVTPDDFSGWSGPGGSKTPNNNTAELQTPTAEIPQTPSTPSTGGLMGRLRAFGKATKRQASEIGTASTSTTVGSEVVTPSEGDTTTVFPKTPLQVLLSHPLTPPTSTDAPPLNLPSNTSVIISQESVSGWTPLYRGFVNATGRDVNTLGEAMPFWLLEYLLVNKVPPIPVMKLSFVMLPYPGKEGEETLPELLNTSQSKLTASRFLRVRKLTHHVQDKLDRIMGGRISAVNTPRSSFDTRSPSRNDGRPRPEETFEILCNDVVLPLDMTLAAVRQFVWRSSGELVMHYRRRTATAGTTPSS